jgi:hypothetical protein
MKLSIKTLKPRNPLVAPSRLRHAGAHRMRAGARRQQAGRELRLEIGRLDDRPRPSP